MNVREHNRDAWDQQVQTGNPWTVPVGDDEIEAAKRGYCRIFLTPTRPVSAKWLGPLAGKDLLCLASGGGQQGPILAAAGARVTVYDNSPRQLDQDRLVAERHSLTIATIEGDMRDLSVFGCDSFDLIVHPVSNVFAPQIRPVWEEAYRVLRPGGCLLAGFGKPFRYIFDDKAYGQGTLIPIHALPYSDLEVLSQKEIQRRREKGIPLEFSNTLEDQIAGQLDAGFVIIGLYEDRDRDQDGDLLSRYTPTYIATRAKKHTTEKGAG